MHPCLAPVILAFALLAAQPPVTSTEGEPASAQEILTETWAEPRPVAPPEGPGRTDFRGGSPLVSNFVSTNAAPEGDMPRNLAFTPDGTTVLVVHRDTDLVTFTTVASRTTFATVDVGDFPVDIAVTPDGQYAIVPDVFDDTVTVIDVATRSVAATIPVTGTQPYRVAVTGDSLFAVVGVINDAVTSAISVIDLTTLTEARSIPTGSQGVIGFFFTPEPGISGNLFTQLALSPDDTTLVLPDRSNARVDLYDIHTGALLASLPTAVGPTAVDVSADGTLAVVTHEGALQTLTVIDLVSPSVTFSHAVGVSLGSQIVRITPDKSHALAAISNNVVFIDLTTGAVSATISTGVVGTIEISFDGQYAFVSNFNSRVIDIAAQTLVATLPLAPCVEARTSPVEHRAVALNNRFREDVHFYATDGASSSVEGVLLSGVDPEGDATRTVALSRDGRHAVAANNTSNNACVIDLTTDTVTAHIPTGRRSLGVAVTPDGNRALVCNIDDDTVSVLDLVSGTNTVNLSVIDGPAEVCISPDGNQAFVSSIVGSDRVHFIDLSGGGATVTGSANGGQMGSIGYTFSVFSGIAVSPDGTTLATCASFDDELRIFDTATRALLVRVPVGDFPIRVAFSPDSQRAYVTHSFSDDVKEVRIAGAGSFVESTVPGIDFPLPVSVDDTGSFVYVGSFGAPAIHVIDTTSDTVVRVVALSAAPRAMALSPADSVLHVALTDGTYVRIRATGATSSLLDQITLSGGPSDLAYACMTATAVVCQPIPDGVDVIRLPPELSCRRGNIDAATGYPANVLLVNGSPGTGDERRVSVDPNDPFTLFLDAPPSNPGGPACYVVYAWAGSPSTATVRELPFSLGTTCMPTPLSVGLPQPRRIANTIGFPGLLGADNWPGPPTGKAPVFLLSLPSGVGRTVTFFLQGIEVDTNAPQGQAGVTNGVEVVSG